MTFNDLLKKRRSHRQLDAQVPLADEQIVATIKAACDLAPVAYGQQTPRIFVLLNDENKGFWEQTATLNDEKKELYQSFAQAKGTVLFFEDRNHTYSLTEKFGIDESLARRYSDENHANISLATWLALEDVDIQATLQHPSQLAKDSIETPDHWTFKAALVFGRGLDSVNAKDSLYDKKGFTVKG
ncbi:nitroreductase family protein [Hutsoniella sourekii]|uniref:nitroreductase family protein n=1 Tax=Hutsoniella sourekii TaxID=87650 RepID=UPI00047F462E|nr:nitroreductase family protein [Hutsoniella sourekii]